MSVDGGDFMCECAERGGFIFVADDVRLNITGGLFSNNLAFRRAGVVSGPVAWSPRNDRLYWGGTSAATRRLLVVC